MTVERNKFTVTHSETKQLEDTAGYIGRQLFVKIDRAIGSSHPDYPETIYPVNYGYIPDTVSADGEELDCYVLGVNMPVYQYTGRCIAVIRRIDDGDDKLVVVPDGIELSDPEIEELTQFQEKYFKHIIIR